MKVAIVPDSSSLLYNFVVKNGHEPLVTSYISPESDEVFDEKVPPFNMNSKIIASGIKLANSKLLSGVIWCMSLITSILEDAEAGIILKKAPEHYTKLYSQLNELILFGCINCANSRNLFVNLLKNKNIPLLELEYPTSNIKIIAMINKVNNFLQLLKKDE